MGFWLLVPGLLMGGDGDGDSGVSVDTGPVLGISTAPFGNYPHGQQPHGRILG
jgi:hypothetical protein